MDSAAKEIAMTGLFEIDDIVEVLSRCQSYGKRGIVVGHFTTPGYPECLVIRVKLDSGETRFYNESSLKKVDEIEREAKEMALTEDFRVANVKFLDGYNGDKLYRFALFDDDVTEGDCVVCDTQNGYCVAEVVSIISADSYGKNVTKEIVSKIDFSEFKRRKEIRTKKAELKKKLDKAVKENQDIYLYETVAKSNSVVAELLEQYKALL